MSDALDIRRPEHVDAAWLTKALRLAGVDAEVATVEAKAVGTGQIGDSVRFRMTYARGGERAPASLVGKFPAADPDSFNAGVMLGNYAREVKFYRHLAPTALVSTPTVYAAELEETTGEFVLLMEDLAPAEQGDQLSGVSLERARLVVEQAARLHASHWQDPLLDTLPWVSSSAAAPASAATPEMVQGLWAAFKMRYGERLQPHWIEVGERLTSRFDRYALVQQNAPRCLTHNDFRPDNMMFGTAAGGRPVTVLDWQSIGYTVGAVDVAYFLAGALPGDVRRAHESELLDLYLEGLERHGVTGYGREALARDYAPGGFLLFLTAFFAAMVVKQTARGDDMFMQMLGSGADHVLEHGGLDRLD